MGAFKELFNTCLGLGFKVADCFMAAIGPVLMALATVCIGFVTYTYFVEVVPLVNLKYGVHLGALITLFGVWLVSNLCFNYYSCQFLGPGQPPLELTHAQKDAQVLDPEKYEGMPYRYCKKCKCIKPMRAHHCSICKKCVLKMDHHCPWVNTCVGHRNYKHFILFLLYLWASSVFFFFICYEDTMKALRGKKRQTGTFLIASVLTLSAMLATTLFATWSGYLLLSNQSTIEFYGNYLSNDERINDVRNPYNLGWKR